MYYRIEEVILVKFNVVNSDVWLQAFSIAAIRGKEAKLFKLNTKSVRLFDFCEIVTC